MSKIYVFGAVIVALLLSGCLHDPTSTASQTNTSQTGSSDMIKPQIMKDSLQAYGNHPQQSTTAYDKVSLKTVEFMKNKNIVTVSCDISGAASNNVDGRFACDKIDSNVITTGCSFIPANNYYLDQGRITLVDCSILMYKTVPGTTYSIRVTDAAGNVEMDAGVTA